MFVICWFHIILTVFTAYVSSTLRDILTRLTPLFNMSKIMKKYRRVTITEKLEILARLEKGEGVLQLAKEFGVTHPAIINIRKKKEELRKYATFIADQQGPSNKKQINDYKNQPLDTALWNWFVQKRLLGEPVSGKLLKAKGLLLNQKLNGPNNFQASEGWLWRFKNRHGIRQLSIQGESLSSDVEAAEQFREQFVAEVQQNYHPENIYNADESGLQWKCLPNKTLASRNEQTAPGRKMLKDRVTMMLCANSTGSHKLKILLIGKYQRPRCFKHVTALPVIYKNQKSSWMNRQLFEEWFTECFIPEVTVEQQRTGRQGKVLLLVDNAPSHKLSPECIAKNPNFIIEFFPANVTAIIQPMDQGIIEKLKRIYRRNLLSELMLGENESSVILLLKNLNLKDCASLLASAWETVTSENIRKSWKPLHTQPMGEDMSSSRQTDVEETVRLLHNIPGCEECDEADTAAWLMTDRNEPGWQVLNDDEIVASTINEVSCCEEAVQEEGEDTDDEISDDAPTAKKALISINIVEKWLLNQSNYDSKHLGQLREIRAAIVAELQQNENA